MSTFPAKSNASIVSTESIIAFWKTVNGLTKKKKKMLMMHFIIESDFASLFQNTPTRNERCLIMMVSDCFLLVILVESNFLETTKVGSICFEIEKLWPNMGLKKETEQYNNLFKGLTWTYSLLLISSGICPLA